MSKAEDAFIAIPGGPFPLCISALKRQLEQDDTI